MQEDLNDYLRGDMGVLAALATLNGRPALDWNYRPDAGGLPAVTMKTISPGTGYDQAGANGLQQARIQFDFWGSSYAGARAACRAVDTALHALSRTTQGDTLFIRANKDSERDLDVTDLAGGARVHHISADWFIHNQPA